MKSWFWEMMQAGQGPYFYLDCRFVVDDATDLRQYLLSHRPDGFHPTQINSPADVLLPDRPSIWQHDNNSRWGFESIYAYDRVIRFERDWMGQSPDSNSFLLKLLDHSGLALQSWSTWAGGEGYDPTAGRSGKDVASLYRHLNGDVSTPDWSEVEVELGRVLSLNDPNGKFTLSECHVESSGQRLVAIFLYRVSRSEDGKAWSRYPEEYELDSTARQVAEKYGFPYRALGACVHSLDDEHHLIGGTITFGVATSS